MKAKNSAKELDQFYTREDIAENLVEVTAQKVSEIYGVDPDAMTYLEPSAGTGAFLRGLSNQGLEGIGYDIDPGVDDIHTADFLNDILDVPERDRIVVIGNPPFGKRARLALDFIERSFEYSDTVAFILPLQLTRYLTQKRIRENARLIYSDVLAPGIFVHDGSGYSVRCVFQVWTLKDTDHSDIRIRTAPPTNHPDFEAAIYNCTDQAEKYFHQSWDFAILRQGWGPFNPVELSDYTSLSRKNQWMFFRSKNKSVIDTLKSLNYESLAEGNTSVRGFGKADVVAAYTTATRSV